MVYSLGLDLVLMKVTESRVLPQYGEDASSLSTPMVL